MEDFKIILYIFGIVIYIIYMVMRKYFSPEEDRPAEHLPPVPQDRPRSAGRPPEGSGPQPNPKEMRPVSREYSPGPPAAPSSTPFEEMMRRMQKPAEKEAEPRVGEMVEKAQERAQEKAEEIRSKAEKARDQVKQRVTDYKRLEARPIINYESTPSWRKALDEETTPRAKTALSIRKKPVHPYAALLQNSKDARAAFVLTQIFERKEW